MEGWHGWDDYAPFYDWENAQTLGRRDVPFWRRLASRNRRSARAGTWLRHRPRCHSACARGRAIVGIDRSEEMLARAAAAQRRARRAAQASARPRRHPAPAVPRSSFPLVIAPYGILQSLLRERDLAATLEAVARVLAPAGHVRPRTGGRPAGVERIPQPGQLAGQRGARRRARSR